jgi:DNA-binding response OmpR family regulator
MVDGAVRFGGIIFDAGHGRVWRAGRTVELDRPTAAILRTLVAEADSDIDKDRLLEVGWPNRVVHENSLAKAISRLRHVLGNDGASLKTVHGYGYRLTAAPAPAEWPLGGGWRERMRRPMPLTGFAVLALAAAWVAGQALAGARDVEPPLLKGEAADAVGRVLWVDDHPQNNEVEKAFLERRKVAVYQVLTTEEALQLLEMYEYDAVISDMNRNERPLDGLNLVREMRRRGDRTPFVLYSVVPSDAQRRLVSQAGGQAATAERGELYRWVDSLVRNPA